VTCPTSATVVAEFQQCLCDSGLVCAGATLCFRTESGDTFAGSCATCVCIAPGACGRLRGYSCDRQRQKDRVKESDSPASVFLSDLRSPILPVTCVDSTMDGNGDCICYPGATCDVSGRRWPFKKKKKKKRSLTCILLATRQPHPPARPSTRLVCPPPPPSSPAGSHPAERGGTVRDQARQRRRDTVLPPGKQRRDCLLWRWGCMCPCVLMLHAVGPTRPHTKNWFQNIIVFLLSGLIEA
jgi:hypothetical protein